MARLIDADKRIAEIKKLYCDGCDNYGGAKCRACWVDDAMCLIEDATTVDAVEVVHGRWIKDKQSKFEHRYNCSACNYRLIDEHCNYCPNCGAKMDGDGNA